MPKVRVLNTTWLGRVPYALGLQLQETQVEGLKKETLPEALFLLEHDPVLTMGRSAHQENVVASQEELDRLGIEKFECGRGGDVTYHGPGQLVAYPLISLTPDRKDVWKYVRGLESAIIRTLAHFDIASGRIEGLTGVWVGNEKIAAIGVRISRWITSHGIALNVNTNLDHFKTIIPCGISDHGVTSMERILPSAPTTKQVASRFAEEFGAEFDREVRWTKKEPVCHV